MLNKPECLIGNKIQQTKKQHSVSNPVPTERGANNPIPHGHNQQQQPRQRFLHRSKGDSPEGNPHGSSPSGVKISILEIPHSHLTHSQRNNSGDMIMQVDNVLPKLNKPQKPTKTE
ncbi:hypothetical protein V8G54_010766 [Vigna mungo]|uniref:Uncharacterized protein n=1 Tax=Vigna mungo TaxID=3915 RepID=A0AAQ3S3F5_VIGMU